MTNPINAIQAAKTVSGRYQFVNTTDVINTLAEHGWMPSQTSIAGVRKPEHVGYQKHLIRFSHSDYDYGDWRLEVIVVNAHAGTNALRIMLGIYRLVCANGLMLGETFDEYRVRHVGNDVLTKVSNAITCICKQAPQVAEAIARMKSTQLTETNINTLKTAFAFKRLEHIDMPAIDFNSVDVIRRDVDKGNSLFTVFNRLQERLIRGGIRYSTVSDGKVRNHTTREIRAVDKLVSLNRWAFDTAMSLVA